MSETLYFSQPSVLNATHLGSARQPSSSCCSVHDEPHGSSFTSRSGASVLLYRHQYTDWADAAPNSVPAMISTLAI